MNSFIKRKESNLGGRTSANPLLSLYMSKIYRTKCIFLEKKGNPVVRKERRKTECE